MQQRRNIPGSYRDMLCECKIDDVNRDIGQLETRDASGRPPIGRMVPANTSSRVRAITNAMTKMDIDAWQSIRLCFAK
jgi:hypothetical protein